MLEPELHRSHGLRIAGDVVNMRETKVVGVPSAHAIKTFESRREAFPISLLNEAK